MVPVTARVEAKNAEPVPIWSGGTTSVATTMVISSIQPTQNPMHVIILHGSAVCPILSLHRGKGTYGHSKCFAVLVGKGHDAAEGGVESNRDNHLYSQVPAFLAEHAGDQFANGQGNAGDALEHVSGRTEASARSETARTDIQPTLPLSVV